MNAANDNRRCTRPRRRRRVAAVSALVWAAGPWLLLPPGFTGPGSLFAQETGKEGNTPAPASLEANSPFLPPDFGRQKEQKADEEAPKGPLSQRVEFRSVISIEDSWLFSLFDAKEKKSLWLELDQPGAAFQVTGYDREDQRIQVSMGGQSEWIGIKVANADAPAARTTSGTPGAARNPPTVKPGRTSSGRVKLNRRTVPRRRVVVPTRRTTESADSDGE